MRRSLIRPSLGILTAVATLAFTPAQSADDTLIGFTSDGSRAQRELEARFDAQLRVENLPAWLKHLTRHPTHVGSPGARANAEWMAEQFRAWGFETRIDEYHVLFPTPKERLVELVAPRRVRMRLEEPALPEDATSGVTRDRLPTYNAYSADGDVEGEVVYVNYGIPADYEELERRGVDVRGKIVLARYGGSWRGIKPKVAAGKGAIACIIYSDPRDDGYFQGDVYPEGAYRMEHGVQRGSVVDMPQYPGDPLTPEVGATRDAERMTREESPTLMTIPVLPISYADARPILEAMEGPVAPEAWRGALPLTYHLGPGPARVHVKLAFNWELTPAYDVIAVMRGSELPDEWVVRGNHIDGWNFGAGDPLSGMVALMEEARAVGELARTGWRPRRTIVYAGWDAEEPGLLGSTEWVEAHAQELDRHAVLYINGDTNGRGFLRVGGSHTLERFVNEIAREVKDPQKGIPVGERLRAYRLVYGGSGEREDAGKRPDLRINALGSGSDYTPFLQHLGIASLDIRYGGEDGGGSYHSIYDSFDHYERFGDPGFAYGIALVQTAGRATLRSANAGVLPFEFGNFAETVAGYVKEVTRLADDLRRETTRANQLIEKGALASVADPTRTFVPPEPKTPVPPIDFGPLNKALKRLQESARQHEQAAKPAGGGTRLPAQAQPALDAVLLRAERALTRPEGLPRRPWYRHFIYAPGFYTGYGVKTLPGVREALEQRNWVEAREQIGLAADTLEKLAEIGRAHV